MIRSVRVKRRDGMTQTYSIKHMYPLGLSLTHDYHPHTLELEETGNDFYPNSTINVPATKDTSASNAVPRKRSTLQWSILVLLINDRKKMKELKMQDMQKKNKKKKTKEKQKTSN